MVYILTAIISLISVQAFCTSEPQAKFEDILGGVKKKYSKAIVDEVRTVMALTHAHMNPRLAACESLECVESLLEENRKEAIDNVLADVSHEKALQYKAECDALIIRERDRFRRPLLQSAKHDEINLGQALIDRTKKVLQEYDIDSSRVNIVGEETQEFGPGAVASVSYDSKHEQATVTYNLEKLYAIDDYTIRHELTHLDRSHIPMDICLMNRVQREHSALTGLQLARSDELEAIIRPVMTHKNSDFILSQLLGKNIINCVRDHRKGIFVTKIGRSKIDTSYPDCSEWLPYALKVKQLRDKGVAPLKIKKV